MPLAETEPNGFVDRVGEIVSLHRDEAERTGHLSQPVVAALRANGAFRWFTPRVFGGIEASPLAVSTAIEALAAVDSAVAWNVASSLAVMRFAAALPDGTAVEMFAATPDLPLAATLYPVGTARTMSGGYEIDIQGRFGSGSDYAERLLMLATVDGGDDAIGAFLLPDEVVNRQNWQSLGMRGTGSHDLEARGVFVPASRTIRVGPGLSLGRHFRGPLYQLPYIAHTTALVAPVALGIAQAALDGLIELVSVRGSATAGKELGARARLHSQLGLARAMLDAARALQRSVLRRVYGDVSGGRPVTLEHRTNLQAAMAQCAKSAFEATDLILRAAGTSGTLPRNRIERHFRDIATLRQHAVFSESRFETAGRLYLGLPPEDYPAAIL